MTDNVNALLVVLDQSYRDDDEGVLRLAQAIRLFAHVADVKLNVESPADWIALCKARDEYRRKIYEAVR